MRFFLIVCVCVSSICVLSCSHEDAASKETIVVSQAHMYEPPPGQTRAAIYLRLENKSANESTLLHASTPAAGTTEIHHTVHEDGMMRMREVKHFKIKPGEISDFEPGGMHIMLFDVDPQPKSGEMIQLKLEFDTGVIDVPVIVKKIG